MLFFNTNFRVVKRLTSSISRQFSPLPGTGQHQGGPEQHLALVTGVAPSTGQGVEPALDHSSFHAHMRLCVRLLLTAVTNHHMVAELK